MKVGKIEVLIFASVVAVTALVFIALMMQGQLAVFIDLLKSYGYLGGFVLGFLSSFTVFIPSPAFFAVIGLATVMDPLLLGIASGIGSGIGEMTTYAVGRGAEAAVHRRKGHLHKNVLRMKKLFKRYHPDVVIFGFAAIPLLPVDAAGLFCGLIGYDWKRFLVVTTVGKIIKYIALAFAGAYGVSWIISFAV